MFELSISFRRKLKKSRVVNSLLLVSGLVPFNIHSKSSLIFLNIYGFMYFTTLSYLLIIIGLQILNTALNLTSLNFIFSLTSTKDTNAPPDNTNSNSSNSFFKETNEVDPPPGVPPSINPIVQYVMSASDFSMYFLNLASKTFIVLKFRELKRIYLELVSLNCVKNISSWTYNEIHLFLLIVSTFVRKVFFIYWEYFGSPRYSKLTTLKFSGAVANSYFVAFYCQEYQMETIQFLLIITVYYVSLNLRNLTTASVDNMKWQSQGRGNRQEINKSNVRVKAISGDSSTGKYEQSSWNEIDAAHLVRSYFEWVDMWRKILDCGGFFILILFFHLVLSLCLVLFIFCTVSYDTSPTSVFAISKLAESVIIICKLVCLGNASHHLQISVSQLMERIAQLNFIWSQKKTPVNYLNSNTNYNGIVQQSSLPLSKVLTLLNYVGRRQHFQLSGLQFFTISRSTLTSVAGVIVTYLVILIQFFQTFLNSTKTK